MENFEFFSPTKIIFGKGTESRVGSETKKFGNKILLCYGGASIKKSGLYVRIVESLNSSGIEFQELSGIMPNPRLSLVRQGIKICQEFGADFILAAGGGSVIDTAKAIAIGVPYEGDVWDFFIGKARPRKSLPKGVVLTIPAAGSEASNSCVITNEEGLLKRSSDEELNRPDYAILNPELTFTLPAFQTACGSADILAHIIERYFTNVTHVDLTDRLCEAAMKTVIDNSLIVLKDPHNYNARAEIMWAGTIAHNNLLGTGRVGDFASHQIEHEISGIYDIAHGAGLAIVLPAYMKYIYKKRVNRFVQFATRVWNLDLSFDDFESTALRGIEKLTEFFKKIQLPTSFKDIGIGDERFEEMAEKCKKPNNGKSGRFIGLDKDDIIKILRIAK